MLNERHNFHCLPHIVSVFKTKSEMGGTCNTHEGNNEFIQK